MYLNQFTFLTDALPGSLSFTSLMSSSYREPIPILCTEETNKSVFNNIPIAQGLNHLLITDIKTHQGWILTHNHFFTWSSHFIFQNIFSFHLKIQLPQISLKFNNTPMIFKLFTQYVMNYMYIAFTHHSQTDGYTITYMTALQIDPFDQSGYGNCLSAPKSKWTAVI